MTRTRTRATTRNHDTRPVPLGWCLDGHHTRCPRTVHLSMQNTATTCTCTCHQEQQP